MELGSTRMGWLKPGARNPSQEPSLDPMESNLKYAAQNVENTLTGPQTPQPPRIYSHAAFILPDNELPFVSSDEVIKRTSAVDGGLFIVVDEIVYDCTEFINEHPGGTQFVESFAGGECTWQFWRFHAKAEMENYGKALRVGRTKGLVNKFVEPKRYIGLRRLGDEWS